MIRDHFRVMVADLRSGKGSVVKLDGRDEVAGGSGLAALLFDKYAHKDRPWNDPDQPLIFAIGPLTGYFPLMSKTVCAFKSPYHDQYAESHAGGRSALAMRFADLDGLVIVGKAPRPSVLHVGLRGLELRDAHYLWGQGVMTSGKHLRHMFPASGFRTIMRIGPAGEQGSAMACINVDTYRHFGRLGGGGVMGDKGLKAIIIQGEGSFEFMPSGCEIGIGKEYPKLFKEIYRQLTSTQMMRKYHDLGTAGNAIPLNELKSMPWRNLQQTSDPEIGKVSGETFAERTLLRNAACAGCPVGCVHIGYVREKIMEDNRFVYKQVSYDHEPNFAAGTMLGVTDPFGVLKILDAIEREGLDAISGGVCIAWATEAMAKGLITEEDTLVPLAFGDVAAYEKAVHHLGRGHTEFYRTLLAGGSRGAAERYGGWDFACVLGQEMAGYATGETFFVSQSLGLRHAHLDSGGYAYDQQDKGKDVDAAVNFLVEDESARCLMNSMVACLFSRGIYKGELIQEALRVLGYAALADTTDAVAERVQSLRWKMRMDTGYDPEGIKIPKRFTEITTWKGPLDAEYMETLRTAYAARIRSLAARTI